ncbi:MAG: hypothetical protein IPL32_17345 [Chloracidobacterium sp.]|nr:hypothetical protein [Chloracidobacterium sp.]
MQILNSGSFINLENREKIEQLIFTARELANAASQTEGFGNAGPSNGQLAVEMWQGAEYMCRDHEEATIKNIFLSNFLERLRDAGRVTMARLPVAEVARIETASPLPTAPHIPAVNTQVPNSPAFPGAGTIPAAATLEKVASIPESVATKDEHLGIVSSTESLDQVAIETHSYSDECVPESELEIIAQADDFLADVDDGSEVEAVDAFDHDETKSLVIETSTLPPSTPSGSVGIVTPPSVLAEKSVTAIVVPAREPYQLENCTIKAVIQVLAEDHGVRKCVISIVTHDFVPEIALAELDAANLINGLPSVLAPVFERYRADFPVKVADKLKKEKSVSKKQSLKAAEKPKASTGQAAENKSADHAATETVVTQPAASVSDQQASLFGS